MCMFLFLYHWCWKSSCTTVSVERCPMELRFKNILLKSLQKLLTATREAYSLNFHVKILESSRKPDWTPQILSNASFDTWSSTERLICSLNSLERHIRLSSFNSSKYSYGSYLINPLPTAFLTYKVFSKVFSFFLSNVCHSHSSNPHVTAFMCLLVWATV